MKSFVLKLISHSFVQGSILYTLSNFVIGFINYLFNLLAARILGPSGYGEIAAFSSYIVIFSIPLSFMSSIIIQKVGKQDQPKQYVSNLFHWYFQSIQQKWYLIALSVCLVPFLPALTNLQPVTIFALATLVLLNLISTFYDGVFQSLHYFSFFSFLSIIAVLIKLGGAVAIGITTPLIELILIFFILSSLVRIAGSHLYFKKQIYIQSSIKKTITTPVHRLLRDRQVVLTVLSAGAITILGFIDVAVAKKTLSAEAAGLYSSWALLAKILFYAIGPLISISFIFFSSAQYKQFHKRILIISLCCISLIGLLAFTLYSTFGNLLVQVFVGSSYIQIAELVKWSGLFGILYILVVFLNNYLLTRQSRGTAILAFSLPLYFIMLFSWGSSLEGIIGVNIIFSTAMVVAHLLILARILHKS